MKKNITTPIGVSQRQLRVGELIKHSLGEIYLLKDRERGGGGGILGLAHCTTGKI